MKKIIFILFILFILLIVFINGCDTQTPEQKQEICKNYCLDNSWENGRWVGFNACNCFNRTIINEN